MGISLKPLSEQAIVITGASSGIGLVTARMAASQGARLVLAARDEGALRDLADEINAAGGQAIYVVADIGVESEVRRIADTAIEWFGGFDTWVNNAGISIYGEIEKTPIADQRRLFDTNYWGVVYGSLEAVRHMRAHGGALINIGSVLSDRAVPLQGVYSASKHAIKGFTEALRMELEEDEAPISVTLIKPGSIASPYNEHARSYLGTLPRVPPPVYAPDLVAEAILRAAVQPVRELTVGGGGRALTLLGALAPRLTDWMMERGAPALQMTERPRTTSADSLYHPSRDGRERSLYGYQIRERSLYTTATLHPVATSLVLLGLGAAVAALLSGRRMGWR